jgi:hypothetical protein
MKPVVISGVPEIILGAWPPPVKNIRRLHFPVLRINLIAIHIQWSTCSFPMP